MADTNVPTHESPDHPLADSEAGPPRKKVRKGTRSCWECKRRKVRCVFATPADTLCNPCKRRRTTCISQEFSDEPEAALDGVNGKQAEVHDRLDRVEALVKTLVEQMSRDANSSSGLFLEGLFGPTHTAATFGRDIFANPMPISRPLTPAASITWVRDLARVPTKYAELSRRLSAAWPSQRELDILLNTQTETSGSLLLKAAGVPNSRPMPLQDVLQLPPPGSHPILVARKLLLLSIVLQGAVSESSIEDSKGLSASGNDIMSRAAEAASLVTGNDELASSIEGIECVLMQSLYHDLTGNPRQAWVAIRRAITMAQMMGLHRGTAANPPLPEIPHLQSQATINPEQMWLRLTQTDRYASLLLGLPHGSSDDVFASPMALESCIPIERMRRLDCLAAGRILQRTVADIKDYATTREIDELLQKAAASMPPQWWLTPDLTTNTTEQDDTTAAAAAAVDGTTLMDQLVHFHMVARLHLPYLLQMHPPPAPTTDDDDNGSKYNYNHDNHNHTYSKITAVTATREMLTRYVTFRRRVSPTGTYCRGMDFFAFVAAATLCVVHVEGWCWRRRRDTNTRGHGLNHLDLLAHQRPSDRGLVERALASIEHIARANADAATAGMVAVLGGLLAVEEDAAKGGVYRTGWCPSSQGGSPAGGGEVGKVVDGGRVICVYIPHFGTVEVEREEEGLLVQETAGGGDVWARDGVDMAFEDLVGGLEEPGVGADEQWAGWVRDGSW